MLELIDFYKNDGFLERWASYGYDVEAANARRKALREKTWNASSWEEAADMVYAFEDEERRIAIEQGVPEDDPDLWRFEAAKKHAL